MTTINDIAKYYTITCNSCGGTVSVKYSPWDDSEYLTFTCDDCGKSLEIDSEVEAGSITMINGSTIKGNENTENKLFPWFMR